MAAASAFSYSSAFPSSTLPRKFPRRERERAQDALIWDIISAAAFSDAHGRISVLSTGRLVNALPDRASRSLRPQALSPLEILRGKDKTRNIVFLEIYQMASPCHSRFSFSLILDRVLVYARLRAGVIGRDARNFIAATVPPFLIKNRGAEYN